MGTVLVSSAFPAEASARPSEVVARLHYELRGTNAATTCSDESSFRALVLARIGRDPFDGGASDPAAEDVTIVIEQESGVFRGTLAIARAGSSKPAQRAFVESSCESVVGALATAAALAIDPAGAMSPAPGAANLPALPPPTATAPGERDLPRAGRYGAPIVTWQGMPPPYAMPTLRAPRPPFRFVTRASGIFAIGELPSASGGVDLSLGFRRAAFALGLEGRVETQLVSTVPKTARVDSLLLTAGIAPCLHYGVGVGCMAARMGALQSHSPDVPGRALQNSVYAAITPRVGVEIPLSKALSFTAFAELGVPLVRTVLVVSGQDEWSAPAGSGALAAGLVLSPP